MQERTRILVVRTLAVLATASILVVPSVVEAGPPSLSTNPGNHVIFPAEGQSAEQQKQDELAAYNWATEQTGWDPYKAHDRLVEQGHAAARTAEQTRGSTVGGAALGGLLGLAIGAIADDAGKGAAIGAATGGLTGGMRSRRTRSSAYTSSEQATKAYKQQFEVWDRNFVAAMEGKGYTVK